MAFKKFYVSQPDMADKTQLQRVINNVQQNVEDEFRAVTTNTVLDNVVIKDVTVNTSAAIQHNLGREPQGYIIIKRSANAQVWNGIITDTTLNLNSSTNVTLTLLVF